jgi:threonine dehydratase
MSNTIRNVWKNIKNVIKTTPLEYNSRLSKQYNCNVYLKREDLQITRSFKLRGSFHKINNLSNNIKKNGLVCASAGNHAQGFAYSCNKLKLEGDIFLPITTPSQKINRIKYFGQQYINLHIKGNILDDSLTLADNFAIENDKQLIHPFNDYDIINGQATIALEICDQISPDIIISPIGGGGLITGITTYMDEIKSNTVVYGVEPKLANSMIQAIENDKPIKIKNICNFVDGGSVSMVGDIPFSMINKVKEVFPIENGDICNELLKLYQNDGIISELAGALSISGLGQISENELRDKNVVCIVSGGNNDITRYPEIIENQMIYLGVKHYFIIKFQQKPGELKKFVTSILSDNDNITRFEYIKKTNKEFGNVLIGIESRDIDNIIYELNSSSFEYIKINETDLIYSYLV